MEKKRRHQFKLIPEGDGFKKKIFFLMKGTRCNELCLS